MNDAASPQGQDTGERGSCEHEYLPFDYDYADGKQGFDVGYECRKCGAIEHRLETKEPEHLYDAYESEWYSTWRL